MKWKKKKEKLKLLWVELEVNREIKIVGISKSLLLRAWRTVL
jgi:hypothetical protein